MEYKITINLSEEDYLNFNKEYVLKFKRLKTILLANLSSVKADCNHLVKKCTWTYIS